MRRINLTVPIYLPERLYTILRALKQKVAPADNVVPMNLLGDRDIEWSWVAAQIPARGAALDFGAGQTNLGLIAAQRGLDVTAVDLEYVRWDYVHPRLRFIHGDILKLPLPMEHFDLVINCSVIEHVGLSGRYGVTEDLPDGDMAAMGRLRNLMKRNGVMLLTIPVGRDAVFAPLTRIYGKDRLPRLLDGFKIEKQDYWVKNQENRWVECDKERALGFKASAGSWDPLKNVYALGCFVLKRV